MCDDDCVPEPEWLSRLVERFAGDGSLALVAGQVVNIGFPGRRQFKGTSRLVGPNGVMEFVADPADAEYYGNLNLALRRQAVAAVGGYDPFLKAGREELDLAASLRRRGYRIAYEPTAVVTHHFTGINYKRGRLLFGAPLMRLYFHFKHHPPVGAAAWRRFAVDELVLLRHDGLRVLRTTASALARGRLRQLPGLAVEWLNLVAARAAIPWLWLRARRASAAVPSPRQAR
jgi:GT2 family glycosyltransferase